MVIIKQLKENRSILIIILVSALLAGGCATSYEAILKGLKEVYPGQPEGYLKPAAVPLSANLLPPPPAPGSAAMENDMEISLKYLSSGDTVRWKQAYTDALLDYPDAIYEFTRRIDPGISVENSPFLFLLLERSAADASASTASAKLQYRRLRPFMVNAQPTCDPESEPFLKTSGSYPSGHSAMGWTWALILSELFPGNAGEILLRGREFGESRVVCNVHWNSDVAEGRFMGSATVAALHGNEEFLHDLQKARLEIKRITKKTIQPVQE